MEESIGTVGDHLHEWRATMEAWKMADNRPTGEGVWGGGAALTLAGQPKQG